MRDASGTQWQEIRLSEHDRDALAVARRLVMRALEDDDPALWSNGAGNVEPRAVLLNLDRLIEDWDNASEEEQS